MERLLVLLICVGLSVPAAAGEFIDTFDGPDGSFPSEYTWTGDPRGEGYFEIHDSTFVHVEGGHVHYFRHADVCGAGIYSFLARDTDWNFAWRITPSDPTIGRCLCLYHEAFYYPHSYTLAELWWSTIPSYPEGQFMWHHASDISIQHYYSGPLVGWHEIVIIDGGTFVEVFADNVLIFETFVEDIPDGYVGLGCGNPGVMTPAFDFVEYSHMGSPVELSSWGQLKAMFR